MPLELNIKRPTIVMDMVLDDYSLTEINGTVLYDQEGYLVKIGRKSVREKDYGTLEIQQALHYPEQAHHGATFQGTHYDNVIPLPAHLTPLVGDVVDVGVGVHAALKTQLVQPWIFADENGDYPEKPLYSLIVLTARLSTEQTDKLFAEGKIASWRDVLAEQERR